MPEDDDRTENEDGRGPGRPIWSGTISFGLVSIPVQLMPAVREGRVPLRLLDKDGTPLARRYYCPAENVEIHPEHIIRGYAIEPERYVTVTEEELEALEPEKSRDIDLRRFVNADEIDPIYFQRAYFMVPAEGSTKAYRLLAETMQRSNRAGIATFVMRDKEYLVAILAENGILRAETMRFHDEIRTPQDVGLSEKHAAPAKEVDRFRRAIRKHAAKSLDLKHLQDASSQQLLDLIRRKNRKGKDVVESAEAAETGGRTVEELMAALQQSLAHTRRKK